MHVQHIISYILINSSMSLYFILRGGNIKASLSSLLVQDVEQEIHEGGLKVYWKIIV